SGDPHLTSEQKGDAAIRDHFRLLQATDNLSLLACVDYRQRSTLLHPLPLHDGGYQGIAVESAGGRRIRLYPYSFAPPSLRFAVPARHVEGKVFARAEELRECFAAAEPVELEITVSA